MKKFVFGLILGAILVATGTCCTPTINIRYPEYRVNQPRYTIEETAYRSVVKLLRSGPDGLDGRGSGLAIDKNNILTAGHFCISEDIDKKDLKFEMIYVNNNDELDTRKNGKVEIAEHSDDIDVCVLKFKKHGLKPIPIVKSYSSVKIHDPIFIVGAPHGYFPVTEEGRVIDPKDKEMGLLTVHVTSTYGNSGGPILNTDGRFIGIVVRKRHDYDHIVSCVPADKIKKYLKKEYKKKKKKKFKEKLKEKLKKRSKKGK